MMKHIPKPMAARLRQRGATLIEVLVSILLMSAGIVSMAAMQVNAVKFSKTSEIRSLATLLANDLADRMRANHPFGADMSVYNQTANYSSAPDALPAEARKICTGTTTCLSTEMAAYDLASWNRDLFRQLPHGTGFVRVAANDQVDIWVVWTDPGSSIDQAADACPANYGATAGVRCMYFRVAL